MEKSTLRIATYNLRNITGFEKIMKFFRSLSFKTSLT